MMKMKKINVTVTIVAGIQLHIVQNGLRGSVILGGHVSTSGRRSRTFLGSFAGTCARIELFASSISGRRLEPGFLTLGSTGGIWNRSICRIR